MELVRTTFKDRIDEIEAYFDFVQNVEVAIGSGGASFDVNGTPYQVSVTQQKIMYSSIYLHLYNLVESTMAQLIDAIERHTTEHVDDIKKLTDSMRKLFVKFTTEPHVHLTYEKRLDKEIELLKVAMGFNDFAMRLPQGGGGNWDAKEIAAFSKNIGIKISLPKAIRQAVEKSFMDEMGPIRTVKVLRNKLAHGNISFAECGEYHSAKEFRVLIDAVTKYLEVVINIYDEFITNQGFKVKENA